jgi:CheY-like chemotaxis protein
MPTSSVRSVPPDVLMDSSRIPKNQSVATVLIVEDDPTVREVWQRLLHGFGYEVVAARDAKEAVTLLAHRPDVAVLDVHLPGASGIWLADEIRRTSPTTAVVLATGDGSLSAADTIRPGIVAYLVKPFHLDQLNAAVDAGARWSEEQRKRTRQ